MLMLPRGVQENCSTITIYVKDNFKLSLLCCWPPRKPCANVVRKEALDRVAQAKDTEAEKAAALTGTAAHGGPPRTGRDYYRVVAPKSKEGIVLIFPSDGSQPTTEDAEVFAHADAASLKNDDITEFYLQLFGGGDGQPLSGGWDQEEPAPQPIIQCDDDTVQDVFWDIFKTIANTRSGRLLLYRLLIEIWRVEKPKGASVANFAEGVPEPGTRGEDGDVGPPFDASGSRVYCRCLLAREAENWTPYYSPGQQGQTARLKVALVTDARYTTVGRQIQGIEGSHPIFFIRSPSKRTLGLYSSALVYHELLHWFHELRDVSRFAVEGWSFTASGVRPDLDVWRSPIIRYYWGEPQPSHTALTQKRATLSPWILSCSGDAACDRVDVEEIRAILGAEPDVDDYLEGDDLSENRYRTELGLPMRFGHNRFLFFEDAQVISKAQVACGGGLLAEDELLRDGGLGRGFVLRDGRFARLFP